MASHVSTRQLEVFVQIATHGSMRAAAGRLHMTQPAVSMALADMERQIGTRLFDRERGRVWLNPRGRALLPWARDLLERHAEFARLAGTDPATLTGELRIGTSNTVGDYRVGELLGTFIRRHPQVNVQLRVANTDAIAAAMRGHQLDVGCVEGLVVDPRMQLLPWRDDRLVVCVPPRHPLARKRVLKPADFAGARWILREPGSATRAASERVLAQLPAGDMVLQLGQIESIKHAVMAGLGIACLPEVAVTDALATGRLRAIKTPFLDLQRKLYLVLHRRVSHGALLEAFLECVREDA